MELQNTLQSYSAFKSLDRYNWYKLTAKADISGLYLPQISMDIPETTAEELGKK